MAARKHIATRLRLQRVSDGAGGFTESVASTQKVYLNVTVHDGVITATVRRGVDVKIDDVIRFTKEVS